MFKYLECNTLTLEVLLIVMSMPPISALSQEINEYGYKLIWTKGHNSGTLWPLTQMYAMYI